MDRVTDAPRGRSNAPTHRTRRSRPVSPASNSGRKLACARSGPASTVTVHGLGTVRPIDFESPDLLATDQFRLEPLGPQHNLAYRRVDVEHRHVRSTPGYPDGNWPPPEGMSLGENLNDLRRHADDFTRRGRLHVHRPRPGHGDVIGCVYVYPSGADAFEVTPAVIGARRPSRVDVPLADAVASWLVSDWPWERLNSCTRG